MPDYIETTALISGAKIYTKIYLAKGAHEFSNSLPSLLVLHGGPGADHTLYTHYWSRFSEIGCQVIFIDQRGQGRSSGWDDPSKWNLKQWARDVYEVCNALEINSPVVAGVSVGGHVAMRYAIDFPGHAKGLVLTDTSGIVDLNYILERFEARLGKEGYAIVESAFRNPTVDRLNAYFSLYLSIISAKGVETPMDDCVDHPEVAVLYNKNEYFTLNLLPELGRVQTPTIIINGDYNPEHPGSLAKTTAEAFPKDVAEFRYYPQAGTHVYDDEPEKVSEDIARFLKRV